MDTEEIIKRLKNPEQYRTTQPSVSTNPVGEEKLMPLKPARRKIGLETIVGVVIGGLLIVTLYLLFMSSNKAENVTAALDPEQVQGLSLAEAEFNPNSDVTYVEVHEGQDRSVMVTELGSTLPIISRFNYQTMTDKNFEIIGAAPWALTTNFSSNISDPEIIQYLLGKEKMINAFLARPDVAPMLEDPKMLEALTKDDATIKDFFTNQTVQAVLADPQMVRVVAGSRFMSHLLISKAVKYFRDRPQEALALIQANPYLEQVRQNPNVQAAVKENPYLKKIAGTLLKTTAKKPAAAKAPSGNTTKTAAQKTNAAKGKKGKTTRSTKK